MLSVATWATSNVLDAKFEKLLVAGVAAFSSAPKFVEVFPAVANGALPIRTVVFTTFVPPLFNVTVKVPVVVRSEVLMAGESVWSSLDPAVIPARFPLTLRLEFVLASDAVPVAVPLFWIVLVVLTPVPFFSTFRLTSVVSVKTKFGVPTTAASHCSCRLLPLTAVLKALRSWSSGHC